MRNALIICQKELRSYFSSPVAYVLLTLWGVVFGYFFWAALGHFLTYTVESQMSGRMYSINLNEQVIRPLLQNVAVIGLFFLPMITMRIFAEEKRTGTIELLVTSPIRDLEIIIGKWLAAMLLYCCLLLFTVIHFLFLFKYGNPDWKPLVIAYVGLVLEAGAMLAIGTFISSLTKNQIIAGATTFAVLILLWVLAWSDFSNAGWAHVLAYMSLVNHSESFMRGVVDLKDGIYYTTLIFLGLFFTARSMESLRWRS
ncbi:MAG: type transporter [Acidobacteriaceae bacterium]|nr:type transporter [Acidobacteriaceae bacterium]